VFVPELIRDVILRDGSALRLRSPQPSDEADIKAFFDALTPESRYLRFHGIARTDIPARDYAQADGDARVALMARLGDRVVAVAGYDRLNEPEAAEVAFAVSEDLRGRGMATRLLEQLAEVAAERGITRFDAEVLGDNRQMLRVFANAGFDVQRRSDFGEVHLALDLRPSERLAERIADRTHAAAVASLRPLLAPRSVAVVGASSRPGSVGGAVFRSIVAGGFVGVATPVHPDGGVVASSRAARSLADLDEPPDLAILAVPAAEVVGVAEEAARCGVRALLVVSTGFSDTDEPEGRAREEALLEAVRAHGLRLVGPNAPGVVNTDPAVGLHALVGEIAVRPGALALASQSGALGLALLGQAAARGLGISSFLALGNRADVSTNDVLEHWADDPRTAVVALYMESFGNPRRFSQVSRRVSRRKPILAVKGGRGRALGEAATDALFRQAGVLRVESTQTLFEAAEVLERQPLPRGRRVGVVTNSGGLGVVAADACAARGLELAAPSEETRARLAAALPDADRLGNPIDLGLRASPADDLEAVDALLADDLVDAVLVLHVELGGGDPAHRLEALELATATTSKPVVACVLGASGELPERATWRVPNYRFPENAVRALSLAADRRDWLSRPMGQAPVVEGLDVERARALVADAGERWLEPGEVQALLDAAGIRVLPAIECADADAAVSAAQRIAGPVALKAGPDHVLLGLEGEGAVRAGWQELVRRAGDARAFVQPLADAGTDAVVHAVADPDLGPVVGVGTRGTPLAHRLAPLTDVDADELAADAPALRDVVVRLAALSEAVPELAEADLQPVRVRDDEALVLDARVRLGPAPERRSAKTW
jgi:acyl-CoA synthetase (NDP forming)/RimJ/RimL family protein N-acetyltransferase